MEFKISLDNITICGSPSDYVFKNLEINPLVKQSWTNEYQLYHYNYALYNGGLIQIKHQSDWNKERTVVCKSCKGKGKIDSEYCLTCGGQGKKIFVNDNAIRIEFNPNQYKNDEAERNMMEILKNCWNPHVTRRDVAFDFYDEKLNDYLILDKMSRKKRLYLDRDGNFETLYIGSNKSDVQIRIYNKAIEQNLDMNWWRVEAQMRKTYADTIYFNPFSTLKIKRKLDFEKYDVRTRAMLFYLTEYPDAINEMSKPVKLKYKNLLMNDVESIELKLSDMYDENIKEIYTELESWLNFSRNSHRHHRSNMARPKQVKHIREITTIKNGILLEKI